MKWETEDGRGRRRDPGWRLEVLAGGGGAPCLAGRVPRPWRGRSMHRCRCPRGGGSYPCPSHWSCSCSAILSVVQPLVLLLLFRRPRPGGRPPYSTHGRLDGSTSSSPPRIVRLCSCSTAGHTSFPRPSSPVEDIIISLAWTWMDRLVYYSITLSREYFTMLYCYNSTQFIY